MLKLSYHQLNKLAARLAERIEALIPVNSAGERLVYPVPRGGVSAALAVSAFTNITLVDDPSVAMLFLDDLIDSGATMQALCDEHPGIPFFALLDKHTDTEFAGQWIVFPWEENESQSIEDNFRRLLQFAGDDPTREGLLETPARAAKAWKHWFGGYAKNAADVLKVFEDGAEKHDQMVTVRDIPFYSHCEHHIAPIFGTVTISYIPNGKIVGLSKLSRLVDVFARRLQVQERLTDQIADALQENLQPLGVGVIIQARHLCMESRGVSQQGHTTLTTALRGVIHDDAQARSEFLRFVR